MSKTDSAGLTAELEAFRADVDRLTTEVGRVIVGQKEIIEGIVICLLADGHVLLEGVPGLGKTMMVRSLAQALSLAFSRIQFTPDLMPADIIGTNIIEQKEDGRKAFEFQFGPLFANLVLADEINRATPKTQSALLEAMQEQRVTVGKTTYRLRAPFMVMATQNPIEMEGTYPLPEAQVDRFLFKLNVSFPDREELALILDRTTGTEEAEVQPVLAGERILEMRGLIREVEVDRVRQDYVVRLLQATHPTTPSAPESVKKYVRYGASPRGGQALLLGAKVTSLLRNRTAVSADDIRSVLKPALRHRIILSFEGEAEGVTPEQVLDAIVDSIEEYGK